MPGAVLIALVTAVGALVGCSSGDGAARALETDGSQTAAGSTPASPAATSPEPKPKPTTKRQQVEAAVREYYAAMDEAMKTGDVTRFESITDPGCDCREFARNIATRFTPGKYTGAGAELVRIDRTDVHGGVATVQVMYRVPTYFENLPDGSQRDVAGKDREVNVGMVEDHNGVWSVTSALLLREIAR